MTGPRNDGTAASRAVEALAAFLIERDWPSGRIGPSKRFEYGSRAAAILNGEAWAIRKTWPDAFTEPSR